MVTRLADLVRQSVAAFNGELETALFDTDDPSRVADALERFVAEAVGPPQSAVLYRTGVGLVVGFEVLDGREVVVKVHRWNVTETRLAAVQSVQAALADAGLPAPRPLVEPASLGNGIATVEQLLRGSRPRDSHAADLRRVLAEELWQFVETARPLSHADIGRPFPHDAGGELWGEPHSLRFDFDATAAGAEWIDDAARQARARLDLDAGPPVIGHFDWRVENLGFADTTVTAIYDWDALAAAPEAVLVGTIADQYCIDWSEDRLDPVPTVEQMHAFVSDYESARGRAFSAAERAQLDAANLLHVAYGARCQHSDTFLHPGLARSDAAWLRLLSERGDHCLDR